MAASSPLSAEEMKNALLSLSDYIEKKIKDKEKDVWMRGITEIIRSKNMLEANVNDIFWFYENGMNRCSSVLDLGCGSGHISFLISKMCKKVFGYEYIGPWVGQNHGQDVYEKNFSAAHQYIKEFGGQVYFSLYKDFPLKIKDGSMDGVVLYAVIEHVDKAIQEIFMREVWRILKPKGFLFIAKLPRVFSYQEAICRLTGQPYHESLYRKNHVVSFLKKNGFSTIKLERTGLFFNHPNSIMNPIFPITRPLEKAINILFPPVNLIAHDFRIIAVKEPK